MKLIHTMVQQKGDHDCSTACLEMLAQALPLAELPDLLAKLPFQIGQLIGDEANYAPTSDELVKLMFDFGVKCSPLRTSSYYKSFIPEPEFSNWAFHKRLFFSKDDLLQMARDHIALLVVKSHRVGSGFHLVIWNGEEIFDPDPTIPQNIEPMTDWSRYDVLEVILFWSIETQCMTQV